VRRKLSREVAAAGLVGTGAPGALVTEADLARLPQPARRYLRFMGVVGRRRDTSFRAHLRCRFKLRPDARWVDAEAWQYDSQPDVARFFFMKLPMAGFVPVHGRDVYAHGRGRMLVRVLDLFTVEDARGPELDVGELVTYLNDAVLLAPSMLLAPGVTWGAVDDGSFDVSIADRGTTVSARVSIDGEGAVRDFSTTDRFFMGKERTRWTTPCDGWQRVEGGRALPTGGRAIWHFPQGPFTYAELRIRPGDVEFNVPPR
jgi:hypothetical protein